MMRHLCDVKNKLEILSGRGVIRPKCMVIVDGVLYYQVIEEINGVLEAIRRIYVPKSLREKVLANAHNIGLGRAQERHRYLQGAGGEALLAEHGKGRAGVHLALRMVLTGEMEQADAPRLSVGLAT